VAIRLDETRIRPLVDVAQGRHLEAAQVLMRLRGPTWSRAEGWLSG
jgi:hypothetical protein